MSYLLKGEYKGSAEAFLKALKIEPENTKIYNNLGIALCRLGKYDTALEAFTKAGDKASAYNNLGCFYLKEKKYEEAIAAFENAIEAKPSYYVKAHENLKRAKTALAAVAPAAGETRQ
jgi:Tfp pilus assembly protein PilF